MSDNVIQTSFAAGELSPNLFARVDFAKYRSGAATMRNFFVDYRSGASTRPGTEFIRPPKPGTKKCRLVRFQQSMTVTYVVEFGDFYIRFITQGSSVVEPFIFIINVTQALPAQVFIPGVWNNGDLIFIQGVPGGGMPQINNRYFIVDNATPGSFTLRDSLTNVPVDATGYDPYISSATASRVYTIASPYSADDLSLLKFSQNASVMNITHPNHPPYKLTLITATNWTLVPAVFGATVAAPVLLSVSSSGGAGPVSYKYAITAVDSDHQEGSPSNVGVLSGTIDLRNTPGSNFVQWSTVAGAVSYNIYGAPPSYLGWGFDVSGLGFIGTTTDPVASFIDSNAAPDFSTTPPIHDNPFAGINPAVSSYFQQRLFYANGGGNFVATFWASKTGAPYNFDFSDPIQANDSFNGALVSLEVNEIKSLIPMPTGLIILTTHGAWQLSGGGGGVATQGGAITSATATATPQAYVGANDVPPILVNYDIIFVQSKGSIIRDLTYNIYANIYTGNDISILSSHLFYGHQILEWAYAEEPFKIIWCIRDDGVLLSLTLVKEQDMYGWARHDTFGNFKSVCSVTEGTLDAVYFVVERPSPTGVGNVLQIERLANREFPFGAEDAWCVDAGLSTIHNFPNATLSVSAATGSVTCITDNPVFDSTMVGWVIRVGGGLITVTTFISPFAVAGTVTQEITDVLPDDPQKRPDNTPSGKWTLDKPFTKVFGLDHLEGQPVAVLADGGVVNDLVVHQGSITLPVPVTNVTVGYAFQAQLQTMYLDLGNEINSVQGKRKKVGALTVRVKDSRGLKAGRTFDTVVPIKELNRTTQLGFPIPLVTADERIVMDPLWDVPGQICLQADDPLPSTVLGVVPEIVIGDSQK